MPWAASTDSEAVVPWAASSCSEAAVPWAASTCSEPVAKVPSLLNELGDVRPRAASLPVAEEAEMLLCTVWRGVCDRETGCWFG